jgi:hypothetical protein
MQHTLLLDAALDALCPYVEDFFRLAPALQKKADSIKSQLAGLAPVVTLHARGGDKESELGIFRDEDGYYPMAPGMEALLAQHPGLRAVPPACIVLGDDADYARAVARQARSILRCSRMLVRAPRKAGAAHDTEQFNNKPLAARCAEAKSYLVRLGRALVNVMGGVILTIHGAACATPVSESAALLLLLFCCSASAAVLLHQVDIDLLAWSTFTVANHRANADTLAMYVRKCRYHRDYRSAVPGAGGTHLNFWI